MRKLLYLLGVFFSVPALAQNYPAGQPPQQQFPQPQYPQQPPNPQQPQYPRNPQQYQQDPQQYQQDPQQQVPQDPQQQYTDTQDPYPTGEGDPDDDSAQPQTDEEAAAAYDEGYDPAAYQQFESALSPYGQWIDDPNYGQIWVPASDSVGADFSPYSSGGHWVYTDWGWTWASDWAWGWAPFHYGRWIWGMGRGWCWRPGTLWGPGWVHWRSGGGYVGWAPLGPHGVTIAPPSGRGGTSWRFVAAGQLGQAHATYVPSASAHVIYNQTRPLANIRTVNANGTQVHLAVGPSAHAISQASGHPIQAVPLHVAAPHAVPKVNVTPRPAMMPARVQPRYQNGGIPITRTPGQSSSGVRAPVQHYNPPPTHNVPSQTYSAPQRYSPPAQQYNPPAQRYNPPVQRYNPPAQQYSPPPQRYNPPQQTYSPPPARYTPPPQPARPSAPVQAPAHQSSPSAPTRFGGGGQNHH